MDLAQLAAAVVKEVPGAIGVWVFGSVARGDAGPGSDVDLAVLGPARLDPVGRWELQERLAVLAGRDVDLVDLRAATTVMRVQVLADGRLLHDGDPSAREFFEAYALSDYARLNEERRGILDDVRASGRIHG